MKLLTLGYLHGYSESDIKDHIVSSYEATREEVDKYEILIAFEEVGPWGCDSSSFFLLQDKKTKNLFEVHASHCSCYGFEGQFKPEPTTVKYLLSDKFSPGYSCNKVEVSKFIKNAFKPKVRVNKKKTTKKALKKVAAQRKLDDYDELFKRINK